MTKDEAGAYLVFAAEENKDYMVWLSHDMRSWSYATMAGCIGPGLYSAHVEACAGAGRSFFMVLEVENGQLVNPQQLLNDLFGMVLFLDELDPQDPVRKEFEQAAGALAGALAEQAAKEQALADQRRQLAGCKAEVERLRLAAMAAWSEATAAESDIADAEDMIGLLGNALVDANADLAEKQANLAEWQTWGTAEIAEAEAAIAAGVTDAERYRLENHIEFINTATERREGFVAEAEAAVNQLQNDLADAEAEAKQKLEDQLEQWKLFLDGIRASHGQAGVDLFMTRLKSEWDQGIAALQLLSGVMEGLARGGTVQAALAGFAMSGIQVGYGALVAYAQNAAVNGVTKLASGRAAEMLKQMSDLKPGESRYHGMKNSKGEVKDHYMVTRNSDGTHTVWAFNDGKGVLSSDSVHQHILKK